MAGITSRDSGPLNGPHNLSDLTQRLHPNAQIGGCDGHCKNETIRNDILPLLIRNHDDLSRF